MRYFKKYDPKVAAYDSLGRPIRFPDFGNGYGGFKTEDSRLIAEFELLMRKSVGGISEITQAEFEALKKKPPMMQDVYRPNLKSLLKSGSGPSDKGQRRGAAAADKELSLPARDENLLTLSEPAKPTGFRPKSIASR